jgi:hypothetical protein
MSWYNMVNMVQHGKHGTSTVQSRYNPVQHGTSMVQAWYKHGSSMRFCCFHGGAPLRHVQPGCHRPSPRCASSRLIKFVVAIVTDADRRLFRRWCASESCMKDARIMRHSDRLNHGSRRCVSNKTVLHVNHDQHRLRLWHCHRGYQVRAPKKRGN